MARVAEVDHGNFVMKRGSDRKDQKFLNRAHAQSFDRCEPLARSAIHGLPATLCMFRVKSDKSDWFWSQSIMVYKAIQNRNVVGPGQRS